MIQEVSLLGGVCTHQKHSSGWFQPRFQVFMFWMGIL